VTPKTPELIANLEMCETRLRWLSAWTIHNANHIRPSRDGLKVGGHQASCASITAIMTALYFHALGPNDRVAVKPHAGPVLHAIHYLLGNQSRDRLERFRGLGGVQSYPSRTKDTIPVDFSTGSVGLGVAITAFASLVQDYLIAHGQLDRSEAGRMIALMGDAELDEGNIYECLIEAYKHDIRNCWWIVDYNRQSLDHTTADRMFNRFDDIFRTCGWRVVTIKHGKRQRAVFAQPGGKAIDDWIDHCPNAEFAALTYQGGAAWRACLTRDLGGLPETAALIASFDDDGLAALMTNLGGHCIETLVDAFAAADDDVPTMFIAYTVKGYGLPFAGHKDNHAGLMNPTQIAGLRDSLGIAAGDEWELYAGLGDNAAATLQTFVAEAPIARVRQPAQGAALPVPARFPVPDGREQSTQAAFGRILLDLAKSDDPGLRAVADRIVTTSPDVTVSTNLGAFVNQRGLFRRQELKDVFQAARIPSPQKWAGHAAGQHIELGIAENNLFLMLAALGLSAPLFGTRLLPVGTVYDPFIARGLDALNYACYQDARFLLVATPSGLTLAPEGGAHQSINSPLIGIGQPGLTAFEPAFVDELALIMRWAFAHMQADDGGSVYLRLTTRSLEQPVRNGTGWEADALNGAYWLREPALGAEAAIVFSGALAPEALAAWDAMIDDVPGLGLLNVTSADLLHRDWFAACAANATSSHADKLLSALSPNAGLVTIVDGSPATLSWLGGVRGLRVSPLGVDCFGQTGDLLDLYHTYRLDSDAMVDAMAVLFR
jgi:pyruvate dehydrogenase E1 component